MKLDFHVHGLLTKKSDFDEDLFLQGVNIAKEQGLDGYVLCEHFNAKSIYQIYEYLDDNYEYIGDKYVVEGMSIFIGMEVDVKNGGHVILSGNRENILRIREYLNDYYVKPDFIELDELIKLGEKYGCLMVGSHPFRDSHKLFLQQKESLERLHAFDLNATDIFSKGLYKTEEEVALLSEEIGVPYVTGSDSHYPIQLGSVKTVFRDDFDSVEEIICAIRNREFEVEVSKCLDTKVYSAKITKKYIKNQLQLKLENRVVF